MGSYETSLTTNGEMFKKKQTIICLEENWKDH